MLILILPSAMQTRQRGAHQGRLLAFSCFCPAFSHFHGFPHMISSPTTPFPICLPASTKPCSIPQAGTEPPPSLPCSRIVDYHWRVSTNQSFFLCSFFSYWSLLHSATAFCRKRSCFVRSSLSITALNIESFDRWFANVFSQSMVSLFILRCILQGANF